MGRLRLRCRLLWNRSMISKVNVLVGQQLETDIKVQRVYQQIRAGAAFFLPSGPRVQLCRKCFWRYTRWGDMYSMILSEMKARTGLLDTIGGAWIRHRLWLRLKSIDNGWGEFGIFHRFQDKNIPWLEWPKIQFRNTRSDIQAAKQ